MFALYRNKFGVALVDTWKCEMNSCKVNGKYEPVHDKDKIKTVAEFFDECRLAYIPKKWQALISMNWL